MRAMVGVVGHEVRQTGNLSLSVLDVHNMSAWGLMLGDIVVGD